MPVYECDACGAFFEFEARTVEDIAFCLECGESEDIKVRDMDCSCSVAEDAPATPRRG